MRKKCHVVYLLDEDGRKKSLLAGGDGKAVQIIETDITKEILDLATVDHDGNAIVTIGFSNYSYKELKKKVFSDTIYGEVVRPQLVTRFRSSEKPHIKDIYEVKLFSNIQTLEELLEYDKKRKDEYEQLLAKVTEELEIELKEYESEQIKIREDFEILKKQQKKILKARDSKLNF